MTITQGKKAIHVTLSKKTNSGTSHACIDANTFYIVYEYNGAYNLL